MDFFSTDDYFEKMNRYWQASNYLSVGQLYLLDNPLLQRPLKQTDVKKKIVGHWGTVPGQNFIYTHLNRVINKFDQNMILISGPGHGGNFFASHAYLEGTYTEFYPEITLDKEGMQKLFKQFSFPYGISSHVAPELPGSMHEGGELGYSLSHAFGAVFDNPDLVATCIVGDGEAETGPLATSWHSNKFLSPKSDGAVLPILHLNGYKISNPTVLSRISKDELIALFKGYGWNPYIVEGDEPMIMHRLMAKALDECILKIRDIQHKARELDIGERPIWPMIILRTPKGWTAPKMVDNSVIEGSFNAHQVPISMAKPEHLDLLEKWLKSYEPQTLFDSSGALLPELKELAPLGDRRISANPITNGGGNRAKDLLLPALEDYQIIIDKVGRTKKQDMLELGKYLAGVFKANENAKNFRIFSPDEAKSNRLNNVFAVTSRAFNLPISAIDEWLAPNGRVLDSYLSEHCCEGWLEGYTLTGRHGIFATYEAFSRIVDSMVSQHIKWLKVCKDIEWRKDVPSLNLLLTSDVWQQDHNGFTHQDPGMIDHISDKKGFVSRAYLPPDANCLMACMKHCLESKNYVNLIVASKHPSYQWQTMEQAIAHCEKGLSEWEFVSSKNSQNPDVILCSCGSTPTLEMIACAKMIKEKLPYIRFKYVNVVDLMRLQNVVDHPHGLSDEEYNKIFLPNIPTIFAYHGYPKLIHEFCYKRQNAFDLHVAGYREEGAITTAFDMRVRNKIDRFNLMKMVLKFVPQIKAEDREKLLQEMERKLVEHKNYVREIGVDMPEITEWEF